MVAYIIVFTLYGWHCLIRRPGALYYQSVSAKDFELAGVNSIYCSITVNHRLTGPGKMVKLCLLFVGKFQIQKFDG